ncbi:MAG: hypothetical protein HQL97_04525 [Magnetococcales bacterium]|nr:hypothetical protein [Magnetococcales bacterium]
MMIFPDWPRPKSIELGSNNPNLVSESHSLRTQVRSRDVHRWMFKLTYGSLNRDEEAAIQAFCAAQRGRLNRFRYVPPVHAVPRGAASGSPKVHGSAHKRDLATGAMLVPTRGWTPSVNGILKKRDFVAFNGHSKVYMLVDDASSDASGHATLRIEPGLFAPVQDNETVIVWDMPFVCSLEADTLSSKLTGGPWYDGIEIGLVERFE